MYKNIYNLFQYLITENIPEIKYVALYNNQFNRLLNERPIPYPAVLVEFGQVNPTQYLNRYQNYKLDIILHLATEIYQGYEFGDEGQQEALAHLDLLDKIHYVLDNKDTTHQPLEDQITTILVGSLQRTSMITNITIENSVRISQIKFSCMVGDATAVPLTTETTIDEIEIILDQPIRPN